MNYTGRYRGFDHRNGVARMFAGRIERHGGGNTRAYVFQPPDALLRRHPVHMCIHPFQESGWYWMNWHAGTNDVDRTIGYMEKVLSESMVLEGDS